MPIVAGIKLRRRILTFVDSSVLIAAFRGEAAIRQRALAILADLNRSFVSSDFVRLEILPKALYFRNEEEAQFYEDFFDIVDEWIAPDSSFVERAFEVGAEAGLSAMDALHIVAARDASADEIIHAEKPEKPWSRIKHPKVTSIHS